MRPAIVKTARCLAYLAVLVLVSYATYWLGRTQYVPTAINVYRCHAGVFREYVELLSLRGDKDKARLAHLAARLNSLGFSQISVNDGFVVFWFDNLPPDSIEVIGRALDPSITTPTDVFDTKEATTYHFDIIDSPWFYWCYDPWIKRAREAEREGQKRAK
jgi:hypothetical protein